MGMAKQKNEEVDGDEEEAEKKHPKSELKQKRKTNASPDMSSKTKSWHAKLKK